MAIRRYFGVLKRLTLLQRFRRSQLSQMSEDCTDKIVELQQVEQVTPRILWEVLIHLENRRTSARERLCHSMPCTRGSHSNKKGRIWETCGDLRPSTRGTTVQFTLELIGTGGDGYLTTEHHCTFKGSEFPNRGAFVLNKNGSWERSGDLGQHTRDCTEVVKFK